MMSKDDSADDIDQIMNEIENLQREIAPKPSTTGTKREEPIVPPPAPVQPQNVTDLSDFRSSKNSDAPLEETLSELKGEDSMASPLNDEVAGGTLFPDDSGSQELSLSVKGNVSVSLKFEQEGDWCTVHFQGPFVVLKLSDGTEFKLPVRRTRQAA